MQYEFSTTVIKRYRRHAAALRRIKRDLDARRIRGNGATAAAAIRHLDATITLTEHLVETQRRHLAGLLTEESDLNSRIAEATEDRPELRLRLNRIRREIRLTAAR